MHDFVLLLLFVQVLLVNGLDGDQLADQLVHPQVHFAKGPSAEHLAGTVEVGGGRWSSGVGLEVFLDHFYYQLDFFPSWSQVFCFDFFKFAFS